MMVRATRPGLLAVTFLVALAVSSVGAAVGWTSLGSGGDPMWAGNARTGGLGFGAITIRNLAAALLLFSGVASAGLTTILTLGLIGIYVGATFAAASGSVGTGAALSSIWLYAPMEFSGLLLAATAGLLPAAALLARGLRPRSGPVRSGLATYSGMTPTSLRLFGVAAAVIVLAAVVESLVLTSR